MGEVAGNGELGFWGHFQAVVEADQAYYPLQAISLIVATLAGSALLPWEADKAHVLWAVALLVSASLPFVSAALRERTSRQLVNQQAELVQMLRAYVSPSLILLQDELAETDGGC